MQVIDFLVDRRLDFYWHTIPVLVKLTQRPSLLDENGWDAFVCVSLRLESRSRKVLEEQYLFHGSYKLSFFFFFK